MVPSGVPAEGAPRQLTAEQWAAVLNPGAPAEAAEAEFADLLLRPGFVLGDTSLVAYFNLRDDEPDWSSWKATLYDADSKTEQHSALLSRDDLTAAKCSGQREYCRSFGAADGWTLRPEKTYFLTLTAVFDDGREVVSRESEEAAPRTTIDPPAIPNPQAAGCACGNALGITARQAIRGSGVNTATGAFSLVEQDLAMASFGVPFASTRVYSSANPAAGPLGPGWAWSYGMRVTDGQDGAVVRAEDGAEALYRLVDGVYQRPAGVRSNLKRVGDGWELVTPRQITFGFDAQGRLEFIRNARKMGVRLAYTETGLTITDASGRVAEVRMTAGLVRDIILPDHRRVQYEYDEQNRLVTVKDARHHIWRYRYSEAGLLTEVVEPEPAKVVAIRNEYDGSGRVIRQRDALDHVTTFAWDTAKQEAKTTDPDGVVIWDGYRRNVLVYTQRGNGDTDNHRYDGTLNRSLVVNGNHNQHEATFDAAGNPIIQKAPQPLNFDEKTKYDERNNPIEHVDGLGNVWRDTYNEFNELVKSVDAEKREITYAYDDRGLLISRTDQRGKVTRYEYHPSGHVNAGLPVAVVSPEDRRSEFRYDDTGRRIATIDPRGTVSGANPEEFTTRYDLDAQDRVVGVHDPGKQHIWRTVHDSVGRTTLTVTPEGAETRYGYLANGLLRSVSDPRRTMSYSYTDAGRRSATRVEMDDEPDIVTTYKYNAKGLLTSVTSPRGNVPGADPADFTTTYRYDANDNLVRISRPYPDGKVVHRDVKVDELDRTTATVDEFNKPSSFQRDNTGKVTEAKDTLGRTTRMEYDRNGRQTGITDADNNVSRFEYDAAGNRTKATTATGGITTWEYDDDGMLIASTEPRGNVEGADKERYTTHYEYDQAGNPSRVIDPLDHTTVYDYDANNRLTAVTDAKGRTTHYTYREDNQPRTVHNPDATWHPSAPHNGATVYDYHADGLLASVRDPNLNQDTFDYDEAGRLTRATDPLGRRMEFGYDVEGNRTSSITLGRNERPDADERAARTIVDTFDIVGRRTQRTLGTDGPVYTWGYDAKDRIASYGDPQGVRKVGYDDEDQITQVTRVEPGRPDETFNYGYDVRGNITTRTYPGGTQITARYDKDSRVTEVTATGGTAGATPATWQFGYDVAGRRTTTTLPTATGLIEKRKYDDAGRLTSIGTERAPDTPDPVPAVQDPVSAFKLDLDELGNPTRVVTTRGGVSESVAYAYDKVDRITSACYGATSCTGPSAGRIDYTYDLVGNRLSQTRTGAAGNDTITYEYDDADQLTREIVKSGGSTRQVDYRYDLDGNQIAAGADRFDYHLDHTLAKATVSGRTTTYGYDATGLRLSATGSGLGGGSDQVTQRWSWDVNGTLPQIALDTVTGAAGQTLEKRGFTYGPDDEPLALLDPASGAHPYTHDWLGGVANMLTPSGQPVTGYDYDPFGNPRSGPTLGNRTEGPAAPGSPAAAAIRNPLQYTGAYQDSSTGNGNYYLRARNYNPGTGRFTSTDPMPTGSSAASAYTYADNNPMVYTDPTGATPEPGSPGAGPATDGPSPEDIAKAQQLQNKSVLDIVLEAGGQLLMEFLGINDIISCLQGNLGSCVSMVIGALPWGKIFKAKKIAETIFRAGKAVVTFFQELKWARAILKGAAEAAERAKAAAAAAAKAAAEKAAAAKAQAERAARAAAARAAARAKALASKAKAKTKKGADRADEAGDSCRAGLPAGARHSFVAGTTVLLADGTRKAIEKVQPGDTVVATEPESGRSEKRQVTHTIRTDHDRKFVDLTIRTGNGDEKITTTTNHPFWSVTRGRWIDAGDLKVGELLRTSSGGYTQLGAVRHYQGNQITYDLTVDAIHTYYVVAGDASVLVHNCGTQTSGRNCTCSNTSQGPGNAYSVAYETQLSPSSYPGVSRGRHFQEANANLLADMDADPEFDRMMESIIPGLRSQLAGPRAVSRRPPAGWTWHHHVDVGRMQLVPLGQHTGANPFQDLFHPGGVGGYEIWG
ncbi:polymorphic toxin-type HINT domain-containing protein [Micromonospora sp. B11E3]|uniref:polymorphic toxin-type HINT domain-containing protein n=1 Tax=Micromonospora sp. B11E3 TaxID=3153562 RepID=UPI00325DE5C0